MQSSVISKDKIFLLIKTMKEYNMVIIDENVKRSTRNKIEILNKLLKDEDGVIDNYKRLKEINDYSYQANELLEEVFAGNKTTYTKDEVKKLCLTVFKSSMEGMKKAINKNNMEV